MRLAHCALGLYYLFYHNIWITSKILLSVFTAKVSMSPGWGIPDTQNKAEGLYYILGKQVRKNILVWEILKQNLTSVV